MATIKDVAQLAGVSFKTVSRVINRSPYVRDEVRQKVLRAADTLEYRPHHHARHMRTQRSKVFAFMSDDIATTPFAGQIIQGAQEAAWQREMLLLTFNTAGDPAMEEAAVQTALERGVEGIIFAINVSPGRAGAQRCLPSSARAGGLLCTQSPGPQRGAG